MSVAACVRSIAALALATATLVIAVTGALFTDTANVGSDTFATLAIDISTSPTSAILTYSGMLRGDTVTGGVTVSNARNNHANETLRYAIKSTTTENTLAAQLDFWMWDETAESDGGTDCGPLFNGPFLYGAGDLGSTSGVNIVGDPAQGGDTGDRTLAQGASEVLCFRVRLPVATSSSFSNLTTTATFDFIAEQTVNNA